MKDITRLEWKTYRKVQKGGLYNMSSPDAVRASGLSINTYRAIQHQYDTLYKKFEGGKDE